MDKRNHFFINASNVHQGGGSTLLRELIEGLPLNTAVSLILDSRMNISVDRDDVDIIRVKPTIFSRLMSEIWISKKTQAHDLTLYFGNLPPLFSLKGKVKVYLQNRYLIDKFPLRNLSFKVQSRIAVERLLFRLGKRYVDEYIVQTPTMKASLIKVIGDDIPIKVLPFAGSSSSISRQEIYLADRAIQKRFCYIASGEPHKNHIILIEAWRLLAAEGIFPTLQLTVDEGIFTDLAALIDKSIKIHRLDIQNLGSISHKRALEVYRSVDALIYPSLFESFGLPLVEASQAGIPILASELDYVRDVCIPNESFSPYSAQSISRAVKRFIGRPDMPIQLLSADQFIQSILQ